MQGNANGVTDVDSFEIVTAIINGATLEIYTQESKYDQAAAYVDEVPVSITQAARAAQNPLVKAIAKQSNWTAYCAA